MIQTNTGTSGSDRTVSNRNVLFLWFSDGYLWFVSGSVLQSAAYPGPPGGLGEWRMIFGGVWSGATGR